MQYQIPQFIEVEDKIFGPLTLKQFIYLTGGAGLSVICWLLIPTFILKVIPIMVIMAFSLALAFYKVNNKPFITLVESATRYLMGPKLYVWKKETKFDLMKSVPVDETPTNTTPLFIPKMADSKLKDMVWSLDVREAENPLTPPTKTNSIKNTVSAQLGKINNMLQ